MSEEEIDRESEGKITLGLLDRNFLVVNPLITMLLIGVLSIVIEAGIAMLLAKWDIKIKI